MLRVVEFQHQGHRYRGEVLPVPDGGAEFSAGGWFVTVDDGPPRRVFEAHPEDADTPAFHHKLIVASWLAEGWNRRSGAERRTRGGRDPSTRDRRTFR